MAERMSRPWSSAPSGKRQLPPASQTGGVVASSRFSEAGSNGSCGAIQGAASDAATRASATIAAATVTGDRRKLHHKSLSRTRRSGDRDQAAPAEATRSANAHPLAVDPEAGVDQMIRKVDAQIDDDKEQSDQDQIGGHDRDIDKTHRLDEHQTHAGPLKY